MRKLTVAFGVVVLALVVVVGVQAFGGSHHVKGQTMTGYQETSSGTPAGLSTDGIRHVRRADRRRRPVDLVRVDIHRVADGCNAVAHPLGNRYTSGGVSLFLCSNLGNGPAGTPACPASPGTVTGTLTPASVVGPTPREFRVGAAGWPRILAAIRAGVTYANVHTTQYPAGEIRTQLNDNDQKQVK